MEFNPLSLVAFGLVLMAGIGGALGAVALGTPDLASLILAFAGGLLVPMPSPIRRNGNGGPK